MNIVSLLFVDLCLNCSVRYHPLGGLWGGSFDESWVGGTDVWPSLSLFPFLFFVATRNAH